MSYEDYCNDEKRQRQCKKWLSQRQACVSSCHRDRHVLVVLIDSLSLVILLCNVFIKNSWYSKYFILYDLNKFLKCYRITSR